MKPTITCQHDDQPGDCFYMGYSVKDKFVWVCSENPGHRIERQAEVADSCPFCGRSRTAHRPDPKPVPQVASSKDGGLTISQKNTIALEVLKGVVFRTGYGRNPNLCAAANKVVDALGARKIIKIAFLGTTKEAEVFGETTVIMLMKTAFGDAFNGAEFYFMDGQTRLSPLSPLTADSKVAVITVERNSNFAVVE